MTANLAALSGTTLRAWWFNPRSGLGTLIGEFPNRSRTFTSPAYGPDWVLVIDDVAANYAPPGLPPR